MKIRIEQRHINDGERSCCFRCPVAQAISEAVNRRVQVSLNHVFFLGVCGDAGCLLPMGVYAKAIRFDETGIMAPFEFELDFDPTILDLFRKRS